MFSREPACPASKLRAVRCGLDSPAGRCRIPASIAFVVAIAPLFVLGNAPALAHEDPSDRRVLLDRRIARDPADLALILQRAEMHRAEGAWSAAVADFERGRRIDPGTPGIDRAIGRVWLQAGHPARALPFLDLSLAAMPGDVETRVLRARALALVSRPREAVAMYAEALELDLREGRVPPPERFLEHARVLVASGGAHRVEALEIVATGLRLLGRPVALDLEACSLERALGRFDDAIARIDRIAAAAPRPGLWLARKAGILEEAGRPAAALEAWRAAKRAFDTSSPARRTTSANQAVLASIGEAIARLDPGASAEGDAP